MKCATIETMEEKKYTGLISLRIDPALHEKIAEAAERENRSLNNYIALVLERNLEKEPVKSSSFENRQFVGRTLEGNKITPENGLVLVDGIYYRYLIDGNKPVHLNKNYVIIEANGNVLVLRAI
ncbi:MAG: type II toxin-antitoxin system HicB family antitoxin [Lactobacillaceae bacterium]|nr:type II toxin-antitoxin system HicB family antitoxin [Lactobacillaceae bacterium]